MPFVMLKKGWPGTFTRTIKTKVKGRESVDRKTFRPGEPIDLSPAEIEAVRSDIGVSLMPIEFDNKGRTRLITDAVEIAEDMLSASKPVD